MSETTGQELRLVLTTDDLEAALELYRDVLDMPEITRFPSPGHNVLLDAGRATIELADRAHAGHVDDVEVGHPVAGTLRLAVRVQELDPTLVGAQRAGARPLAEPRDMPWGDRAVRIEDGDGIQLTLFQPR